MHERKKALEDGELYYFGRPCYKGHEPKRYAQSGHCVQCSLTKGSAQYLKNRQVMIDRAKNRFAKIKSNPLEYEKYIESRRPLNRKYKGIPNPTRPEPSNCECCGKSPDGGSLRMNIDHDHVTGKFRGWLCWSCNTAIGKLGDSIEGVELALKYLKKAAENS